MRNTLTSRTESSAITSRQCCHTWGGGREGGGEGGREGGGEGGRGRGREGGEGGREEGRVGINSLYHCEMP